MRISKVAKKSMAVAMAMAVAVGSVAVAPTKDASAAKAKSKKVNARVFFAGNAKGADCIWIAGDGKSVKESCRSYCMYSRFSKCSQIFQESKMLWYYS